MKKNNNNKINQRMEKHNNKLNESKPHPIIAGIIDYYFLEYIKGAAIALTTNLISTKLIIVLFVSLGFSCLILISVILYHSRFSAKTGFLSIGELCTGRKKENGEKTWINPKGKSRELYFGIIIFFSVILGVTFAGNSKGIIYPLHNIVALFLSYMLFIFASVYCGQKKYINKKKTAEIKEASVYKKTPAVLVFFKSIIEPTPYVEMFLKNSNANLGIIIGLLSILFLRFLNDFFDREISIDKIIQAIPETIWKGIFIFIFNTLIIFLIAKIFGTKTRIFEATSKIGYARIFTVLLFFVHIPLNFVAKAFTNNAGNKLILFLAIICLFVIFYSLFLYFRILKKWYEELFKLSSKKAVFFIIIATIIIYTFNTYFYYN